MSSKAEARYKKVIPALKKLMKRKGDERSCEAVIDSSVPQNSWMKARKPKMYGCKDVLKSIAWIWRILGLYPFTLRDPTTTTAYRINKYWALYSVSLCLMCIANFIRAMIRYQAQFRDDLSIKPVTVGLRTVGSLLCMIVSNILRIFRHKQLSESIEMMSAQEAILEKLTRRLAYETNAKMIGTYVWTSVMVVVILTFYDYYASLQSFGKVNTANWLLWIIPCIAQVINLTIFVSLVGLLGLRFHTLNEKIRAIAKRANASGPEFIVNSTYCANSLKLAAKTHYNICSIGKRINSHFHWDVTINVVIAFLILSTTLYYIFVEVQRDGDTDYVRIGTYVHWEFIHSCPIIVMVAICNWTTRQGSHAGKLIHEIRVAKTDHRLFEAVKSFSLQLHHQKLEFTACGFFPINSILLQTMVGNITTYLVILIQFQPKITK